MTMTIKQYEKKIQQIKEKLVALGDMHPGSLSKQWNMCGNPTCACKDPNDPKKHGPYYNLSFNYKGRSTSRFIQEQFVPQIEDQLKNYKIFKSLVDDWKATATELAKLKIDNQKKAK